MPVPMSKTLNAQELQQLAQAKPERCTCALQACRGWESVSDERWPAAHMQLVGTLRQAVPEDQTEPTFEEYHPHGTRYGSPDAPIALAFFPFNRCDVHHCSRCGCVALKYTEYGGYYIDPRVRLVDADQVVLPSAG